METLLLGEELGTIMVWAMIGLFFVFVFIAGVMVASLGKPWLQAFLSGHGISFLQIVAMKMRKINPNHIIPHGIAAAQAGFPIEWTELESAHLQGADIEKVVTAFIVSSKKEDPFTFEEIVNAERESRLQEMIES